MLKSKKSSGLSNEKGMAIFEMIPIMIVIVLLLNFSLGFFGAIHTGILNSIAARNYAFSTFNHRANLTYIRNTMQEKVHYKNIGMRFHGIHDEQLENIKWNATPRKIDFLDYGNRVEYDPKTSNYHATQVNTICDYGDKSCNGPRNEKVGVNPIWIKTSYGICLNAACGT